MIRRTRDTLRFPEFPDETADDLFLDSLFGLNERTMVNRSDTALSKVLTQPKTYYVG